MDKVILLLSAIFLLATISLIAQTTNNLQLPTSINDDGTAPDPSAILDVQSTDKGMLLPRMTTAQRNGIASPATGLSVFDTDEESFFYWDGTKWFSLGIPTDGELNQFLKPDENGIATWQPLIDSTLWPMLDPKLSGSLSIGGFPWSVAVQGNFAYIVDQISDDLKVIDISNPASPNLSGSLSIGSDPWSVAVQGNFAYIVDFGSEDLKVIDISNPASPNLSGSLFIGNIPYSVAVQGNFAYIVDGGSEDLKVIDISNPASPNLSGSLSIGSHPPSVAVQGNFAYIVDLSSDDLKVIDISNPASPNLSGSLSIGSTPRSVAVQGNFAYIVDSGTDDLKVIDISNPASPNLSGSLSIGSTPNSVAVQGNFAYIVDRSSDDLKVIDISNPASPNLSGSLSIGSTPNSVAVQGNFAYIVDSGTDDLKVIQLGSTGVAIGINGEIVPNNDTDPNNELINSATLNGNNLEITDAGGTTTVDLSGLQESDPEVGVNTINYLPKWDGSALVKSNSVFEDGSGKVGIGTPTPDVKLQVEGGTDVSPTGGGYIVTKLGTNGQNIAIDENEIMARDNNGAASLNLNNEGGNVVINGTNTTGGHLGIGTTTPNSKLSISPSSVESKMTLYDGGSATDHYGFGISSGQLNYHVSSSSADHVFYASGKNGDGTELMRIKGNGNVGIGTSNPLGKLSLTNNNVSTVDLLFRTDDGTLGNTNWNTARIQAGWETGETAWSDAFLKFENPTASNTYSTTMALKGGYVGIGESNPGSKLHVKHDAGFGFRLQHSSEPSNWWEQFHSNGDNRFELWYSNNLRGHFDPSSGDYSSTSDRKLKANISSLHSILPSLMQLQAKKYTYKSDTENVEHLGFIAQEVEKLFPQLVTKPSDDGERERPYLMNYSGFGVIAIRAIQEQQALIQQQQNEIDSLQFKLTELDELKKRMVQLEAALLKLDSSSQKTTE